MIKLFFDFIEIGTSDFATLIEEADDNTQGLSIDPIQLYLDNLPCPRNCQKLNAAISNTDGQSTAYYITPENIVKHDLPNWVRGCNSIGEGHPTVIKLLKERALAFDQIVTAVDIPVYRLLTVFQNYRIESVYFLKIDTEGHDVVILENFVEICERKHLPHQLLFETNSLSDSHRVHHLIAKLLLCGYDIVRSETGGGGTNTHLRLNITRLENRDSFKKTSRGYYLPNYPLGYDPEAPPHGTSLEDAQQYCRDIAASGVTLQNGRFEVRQGSFLQFDKRYKSVESWVYI